MEELCLSLSRLINFIYHNWWAILFAITLLKHRRVTGMIFCVVNIINSVYEYEMSKTLYIVMIIFVMVGAIQERDIDKSINNIYLPPTFDPYKNE